MTENTALAILGKLQLYNKPFKFCFFQVKSWLLASLTSFIVLTTNVVWANDASQNSSTAGHKVHFSVIESQSVNNDNVSITFNRIEEGLTPESVANQINQQMQAAVQILKNYPDIVIQTSQYNIYPVYKKQVISHWRGQQSLILTLENKPGLVQILAKIQPYLAYKTMQFGVSDALHNQIKRTLIDRAIHNYRIQANHIAKGFNASNYRILETHINSNGNVQPKPYMARAEMAMSAGSVAPAIQSGQSKITVTVSGIIQLTD